MLNVSSVDICFVNADKFWVKQYPAGHKLRSVVPLAFFANELIKQKIGLSGSKNRFKRPFYRFPKIRKVFSV